jgi:hypothetical protein
VKVGKSTARRSYKHVPHVYGTLQGKRASLGAMRPWTVPTTCGKSPVIRPSGAVLTTNVAQRVAFKSGGFMHL